MADPYVPFSYAPPPFLDAPMRPRTPRSMAEMGFQPFVPLGPSGAMPTTGEQEALQQNFNTVNNMAQIGAPFALGGPIGRVTGWAGPRIWQLAKMFPEAAAGAGAVGGTAALMDQMGSTATEAADKGAARPPTQEEREAIMATQRRLVKKGLLPSNGVDGVQSTRTMEALRREQEMDAAEASRRQAEDALALERAKNETERERLRNEQAEREKRIAEGKQADAIIQQGIERQRNMPPSMYDSPWAPWIERGGGLLEGMLTRGAINWLSNSGTRETVRRASDLASRMGQGDVPERVGRVNEFWQLGRQSGRAPFSFAPDARPYPWAINPNAAPPNELFGRSFGQQTLPFAASAALPAAELGYGMYMEPQARAEWDAANSVLNERDETGRQIGVTPTNIDRLQAAKDETKMWEAVQRVGQGGLGGAILSEIKSRAAHSSLRPSVGAADTERGRLTLELTPQPQPPTPPPGGGGGNPGLASLGTAQRTPAFPPAEPSPPPAPRSSQPRIPRGQPGGGRWLKR